MSEDLATLRSIFAARPALHIHFLQNVLQAHGSLPQACTYLSTLPDSLIPAPPPQSITHLQPTRLDLSDAAQSSQILTNLKDMILPAVTARLAGTTFADVCGDTDSIKYSLRDLRLSQLRLDPSCVTTDVENAHVKVHARQASMQVTIGSWAYRIRYLPLRDAGRAVVSCTGVEAAITLREEGHGLRVMACHCTVEGVSVDMNEARLSWLYNTLAPVVRGHLRRAVSTGLEYAVRDALEHHMEQWADWATHDLDQLPVRR